MRKLLKFTWYSTAIVMISLALLMTVLRSMTPLLTQRKTQLQQFASHLIHRPIRIGTVHAGMYWFSPKLVFDDVVIYDKAHQHELLRVHHVAVTLRVIASLLSHQWQPGILIVDGATLSASHRSDGTLEIAGMTASASTNRSNNGLLSWLLSQDEILLKHINLQWHTIDHRVLPFSNLYVALINEGSAHYFHGQFRLEQTQASVVKLIGRLHGLAEQPQQWSGLLYLQAKNVVMQQWLPATSVQGWQLTSGTASGAVWMQLDNSHLQHIHSHLSAEHVNFEHADSHQSILLQRLAGNGYWQRSEQGWQLSASDMAVTYQGHRWPQNTLGLAYSAQSKRWQVAVGYLNLNDMQSFLSALKLPNVQGELSQIHASWSPSQPWHVQGQFRQLTLPQFGQLPAISNATGHINLTPTAGKLTLLSNDLLIGENPWHAKPIMLQRLRGKFAFQRNDQGIAVSAKHLYLRLPTAEVSGEFAWHPEDSDDNLSAILSFNARDPATTFQQLDAKWLDPELYRWLQMSLNHSGSVSGRLLVNGPKQELPFLQHQGVLQFDMALHDVDLKYHKNWPQLQHANGHLHFINDAMTGTVDDAVMAGTRLQHINIGIADMRKFHKILDIKGRVSQDFPHYLQFINSSPLQEDLGRLNTLRYLGDLHLDLDLSIPLHEAAKSTLRGAITLAHGQLQIPGLPIAITKIASKIFFTKKSINSEALTATVDDIPVHAVIKTTDSKTVLPMTQIDLALPVAIDKIRHYVPAAWLQHLMGETMAQVSINVPHQGQAPMTVTVRSNTVGITSLLPHPFEKVPQAPLDVELAVTPGRQGVLVRGQLGERLNAALIFAKTTHQLRSADIRFGKQVASYPPIDEIRIGGKVEQLSLTDWQALGGDQGKTALPPIRQVDLQIGKLYGFGQLWQNMHVHADSRPDAWLLQLNGENAQGQLEWTSKAKQPLQVQLSRLHWQTSSTKSLIADIDPKQLPAMHVAIDDFQYGRKVFGKVGLDTQPNANGLTINQLSLQSPAFQLQSQGSWQGAGVHSKTQLKGEAISMGMGPTLKQWDLAPVIEARRGYFGFELDWQGTPYHPQLASMNGDVQLQINDGRITHLSEETERKIGLGKLLSILSLQEIPRRLTLDFQDISGQGLPFAMFAGRFHIKHGQATTRDAYIDGPVAFIKLDGAIGFAAKDYALDLKVTPHVEATLPIIATIAGGPIAGAATWVASNVFGHEFHHVSYYKYHLHGSWETPTVQQASVMRHAQGKQPA